MRTEVLLPRIGEGILEAKIGKVLVEPDQYIDEGQTYIHIHTDKADIELPSPHAGTVISVPVRVGQTKRVDDLLMVIDTGQERRVIDRNAESANVRTALYNLAAIDPVDLCCGKRLGKYTFEELQDSIEEILSLTLTHQDLRLKDLDGASLRQLENALFFVFSLIDKLRTFKPKAVSAAAEYARVTREFNVYKDDAVSLLAEALQTAAHIIEPSGVSSSSVVAEEYQSTRAFVFISYSHADRKLADRLAARFRQRRVPHFLDVKRVAWGDDLPGTVHDALEKATHVLVIISPGSAKSSWVPYEIGFARARGIKVIPYLTHGEMDVPDFLRNIFQVSSESEERDFVDSMAVFRRPSPPLALAASFFSEWSPGAVAEMLQGAGEVWHQAVTNFSFLQECRRPLIDLIRRGGLIRCVFASAPGDAARMAEQRSPGMSNKKEFLTAWEVRTWGQLREIAAHSIAKEQMKARTIDHLIEPILTVLDPQSEAGVMFVTLSGFQQSLAARPSFVLHRLGDGRWFDFYLDSFRRLWDHPSCQEVDLGRLGLGAEKPRR